MVTRNRERVRAHRRANEQAILDATETLLRDRPYRDLAIDDVMAVTGLTRTAFYRYFPDLESVLLRLVQDIASELATVTTRWIEADPAEGRAALVHAGLGLAETYRTHGRLLAAFADAAAVSHDVDDAWRAVIGGFVDDNITRLTELCAQGFCTLEHPDRDGPCAGVDDRALPPRDLRTGQRTPHRGGRRDPRRDLGSRRLRRNTRTHGEARTLRPDATGRPRADRARRSHAAVEHKQPTAEVSMSSRSTAFASQALDPKVVHSAPPQTARRWRRQPS